MEVNKRYLQTMRVLYGREAAEHIEASVLRIIVTLESMEISQQKAIIAILDEEVKKAIVFF